MDNHGKIMKGLWVVLLLTYIFIFGVIFNYDSASFSDEKLVSHAWILADGKGWHWKDFGTFLDTEAIELSGDRLSRPVSNFMEVLNAKFRANCWNFIPPHPSLSIMWLISLFILPYFLFKFFRNMGCAPPIAFVGSCWYIASLGCLSPLVMLFHPAKGLVNFFGVLVLFIGSKFYAQWVQKPGPSSLADIPHGRCWAAGLFACLVLALFSDETGLFIYPMAIVLFIPALFWRFKERWLLIGGMLSLPVLYGIALRWALPALHHWRSGHMGDDLRNFVSYPHIKDLFFPNFHNLGTNFYWLLGDHPHVRFNIFDFLPYPHLFVIQVLYNIAMAIVVYAFVRNFNFKRVRLIALCMLLIVFFVFFHTFQLSNNAKVWGVWWYGSLFSLLYGLALTFILQHAWEGEKTLVLRRSLVFIFAIMACHSLVFGTYRYNYFNGLPEPSVGHPFIPTDTLQYRNFSFLESARLARCKYLYVTHQWAEARHKLFTNIPETDACTQELRQDKIFMLQSRYLYLEL